MRLGSLVLLSVAVLVASFGHPATPAAGRVALGGAARLQAPQPLDAEIQAFVRSGPASATIAALAPGEVALLALNAQPSGTALVAYVGDPAVLPVRLPRGQWWLYIMGSDGRIRQSRDVLNIAAPARIASLEFGRVDVPGDSPSQIAALSLLVHFVLSSQLATWQPVALIADSRRAGSMSRADYDALDGLTQALAARRDPVLRAADILSRGAIGLAPERDAPGTVRAASAGVWDSIKDSFLGFFTSDAMTGASARKDIEALTQEYSPGQREEIFQIARQRQGVDAANADEFFRRLADGAYDRQARQLHQDFVASSENYAIDAGTTGRRPLDTAVRDGGQLVRDGAQFYADAIKTVLGARFGPDFDKGWELTQKIADKLTEVDEAIKDPVAFARDLALGELGDRLEEIEDGIKERMQARILDALRNAGLSEEDAERIAGDITDRVVEASKERIKEAAAAIRDQVVLGQSPPPTAAPAPTPEPTRPAEPTAEQPPPSPTQPIVVPTPTEAPPAPATPTEVALSTPTPTSAVLSRAGAAVSPNSGLQGTAFQLTGTGFQPGEQVLVTVGPAGASPGILTANTAGMVQGLILVSASDPQGSYTASLTGTTGARATAFFTVTAGATPTSRRQATAFANPPSGPAGTTFQLTGSGFAPGEQVAVSVTSPTGALMGTLIGDGFGQVVGSVQTTTADGPGTYFATLTGTASGAQAMATFTVGPGATATPVATLPPTPVPATPTPSEPYAVFLVGDDVMVGRRSEIENTATCNLRGWGIDCSKRVRDVATVRQEIGPFTSYSDARSAYCGSIQPGTVRTVPLTGGLQKARFTFDGQEHWIPNAPGC